MADHSTVNGSEIPVYNLKCIDLANPDVHQSAAVLKQILGRRIILVLMWLKMIQIVESFSMARIFGLQQVIQDNNFSSN
ncbi:hypothetical protein CISIN_1g0293442mg, partial [Citrus sinensis]